MAFSMNKLICTRYPQTVDPPLPPAWLQMPYMFDSNLAPRTTDKEMYDNLRKSFAKVPPASDCHDEKRIPQRCGSAMEAARQRVDKAMHCKPLVNAVHHPGSRQTVDAQLSHLPEMAMGAFNTPCPHLRSKTSFDLTRNSPTDKALREKMRRCKIPPVTAVCSRRPGGLIECTFLGKKPQSHCTYQ